MNDPSPSLSASFYCKMHIGHDEFVAIVRDAASEDDIADWLRNRIDVAKLAGWNAQRMNIHLSDIVEPQRARTVRAHAGAATVLTETLILDVPDADDAALSAA